MPGLGSGADAYSVMIGFSASKVDGIFRIGTSVIDGSDVLGYEFFSGFTGPYDDVTNDSKTFYIRRGRPNQLQAIQAGHCDLTLLNRNYKYTPENVLSPLYPTIKPMRPIQISATSSSSIYILYRGFIEEVGGNPDWGSTEAQFNFDDFFLWMDRMDGPVLPDLGATTVGTAIGRVLDSMGWLDPNFRSLDTGSSIPSFSADGSKSALQVIDDLLVADRGVFYISREGIATYESRHARDLKTSLFTLTDVVLGQPGVSVRDINNRARVTREGGATQAFVDTASKNEYGVADAGEITTPYLFTDADAAYLAEYIVYRSKDPKPLFWELEVTEAHTARANLLQLDLFDRFTINSSIPGMSGDYFVEQIEHWGEGATLHRSKWTLSKSVQKAAFRIGVSTIDGQDVLVY